MPAAIPTVHAYARSLIPIHTPTHRHMAEQSINHDHALTGCKKPDLAVRRANLKHGRRLKCLPMLHGARIAALVVLLGPSGRPKLKPSQTRGGDVRGMNFLHPSRKSATSSGPQPGTHSLIHDPSRPSRQSWKGLAVSQGAACLMDPTSTFLVSRQFSRWVRRRRSSH